MTAVLADEIDLPRLAARLLQAAGVPSDGLGTPSRLHGGRNNRVFRLDAPGAAPLVLKCYHHDPRDPRDRLRAEWAFLRYAWDVCGLRRVPQPLAAEPEAHAALYGFVPGDRVRVVGEEHVAVAAGFIAALNQPATRAAAAELGAGSEACFSMAAHAATIARRVVRLEAHLDPDAPGAADAAALVRERLTPAWQRVAAGLPADEATLPWCVSPSDFGFHNALKDADGALVFLDFEYAGRDDPAKLICDFFCQPELPVPAAQYAAFRDQVLGALGLDAPSHRARCDALLPAYRLKWACIMLNDFLATDSARRDFAGGADRAARCAAQLAKAARVLDEI